MKGGTLAGRIFGALAGVLALAFAALWLWGEGRIRAFHRGEVERRLDGVAEALLLRAREWISPRADGPALRAEVGSLGGDGRLRVTVIDRSGTVLADNVAALPLENHLQREEIQEALRNAGPGPSRGTAVRTSASTGVPTLYLARPVPGADGRIEGILRVAEPLDLVEAEVASLRAALLLGGAGALLLGLLASAVVARLLARPLRTMGSAASAIAAGDLDGRVAEEGPGEIARLAASLNAMAGQIRDRIEAERKVRGNLEAVLAGVAEGVVAVDAEERILFMNGAAAALLGLPAPLPAGAALGEGVGLPDVEGLLRASLRGDEPDVRDASLPTRTGRMLEITARGLGSTAGAVVLLRDVTEVRRLEKMRMDFVANVSHELRTPLAGVSGALETLEAPDLETAERAKFLGIAQRNAERMGALVSDLLDLSAIEAEEGRMAKEPIPLERVVRTAAAALAPAAKKAGVGLAVEPPPAGDLAVLAHPRRLEQAILNLVENAVKYTGEGGRVTVRILDRGPHLAVEVEDTGVGIPASALPRVFERFFRVDRSRSRAVGGTGLGLAIVKHVARAHGGSVEVRSVEGMGSTFTLLVPRAGAE